MKSFEFRNNNELGTPQFSESRSKEWSRERKKLVRDKNVFQATTGPFEDIQIAIIKHRKVYLNTIELICRQHLQRERKIFEKISDKADINLLLLTRPKILRLPRKSSSTPEPRFFHKSQSSDLYKNPPRNRISPIPPTPDFQKIALIHKLQSNNEAYLTKLTEDIESHWKSKIQILGERLFELESINRSKQLKIEDDFKCANEVQKKQYKRALEAEIEREIKKQYLHKRSQIKQVVHIKDRAKNIKRLQHKIESEQRSRIEYERSRWKSEDFEELRGKCKESISREQNMVELQTAKEIFNQAETEKNAVIIRLSNDSEEAILHRLREIDEIKSCKEIKELELLQRECELEMQQEVEEMYKKKMCIAITDQVRAVLANKIEVELKLTLEDRVYHELSRDAEIDYKVFKEKALNDQAADIKKLEEGLLETKNSKIQEISEKALKLSSKALKISYLKKLDRLKTTLRDEYEELYLGQIKKLKSIIVQEKSEAGRIKSQLNIYVNKISLETNSNLRFLQCEEELLNKKVRNLTYRAQSVQGHSKERFTPDRSKSPIETKASMVSSSIISTGHEAIKNMPKPLLPPSLNGNFEESHKRSISPDRRLLRHYDTKEIVNQIILKGFEEEVTLKAKDALRVPRCKASFVEINDFLKSRQKFGGKTWRNT